MRAYELMIIVDSDVDDAGQKAVYARTGELIEGDGGTVASTDIWGKRRYAYPINKKLEGYYSVFEISTPASNLDELDRYLRLADDVVCICARTQHSRSTPPEHTVECEEKAFPRPLRAVSNGTDNRRLFVQRGDNGAPDDGHD